MEEKPKAEETHEKNAVLTKDDIIDLTQVANLPEDEGNGVIDFSDIAKTGSKDGADIIELTEPVPFPEDEDSEVIELLEAVEPETPGEIEFSEPIELDQDNLDSPLFAEQEDTPAEKKPIELSADLEPAVFQEGENLDFEQTAGIAEELPDEPLSDSEEGLDDDFDEEIVFDEDPLKATQDLELALDDTDLDLDLDDEDLLKSMGMELKDEPEPQVPVGEASQAPPPAVSEEQIERIVTQTIERMLTDKIEQVLREAIEKAVTQEIEKLKQMMLDELKE